MKFLQQYFDEDIPLIELNKCFKNYEKYLESIKNYFNEETFDILHSGELHDCELLKINLDQYMTESEENKTKIVIDLEGYVEYNYKCTYTDISFLSFNKNFDSHYDLLVNECTLNKKTFTHEIVFVGENSFIIKCKKINIQRIKKR